jgi:predicted permease
MAFSALLDRMLGRHRAEHEMDEELRFHLEERAADLEGQGLPRGEAFRRARLEFGSLEGYKEECREAWGLHGLRTFLGDLRFGLRLLWTRPGFALINVACLTFGIGANAAVFSWVEGTLLRPYPLVARQDRLFVLAATAKGTPGFDDLSWPDFQDLRRNCTLFDAFVAEKITGATLQVGGQVERVVGSLVSANYFDAMGVRPLLGRGFAPQEDADRNAHPVVVVSYQFWQERLGGRPDVLGKTQVLSGRSYTIVGVAPRGFYGTFVGYPWQFWVPASMQESFDSEGYKLADRGGRWIEGFARLRDGVTPEQAQEELRAVARRLEASYPETNRGRSVELLPLWRSPFNASSVVLPTLGVSAVVGFFVLLIACANVSNLLLVRSLGRQREMTIRVAIGAGRGRLVRQLLTEGLVLALASLAGALLVAWGARNLLVWLLPSRGTPVHIAGVLDARVILVSLVSCGLAVLLFSLVPALKTSRVNLAGALKSDTGGVVGGSATPWVRSSLVLLQVSLSFVLLVGAALMLRSLHRIRGASPGFDTEGVVVAPVNLQAAGYDAPRARGLEDRLAERAEGLPGVEATAFARIPPFSYRTYSSSPIAAEGDDPGPGERPTSEFDEVGPGFFSTLGVPILEGRGFLDSDDERTPPVAVVNETLARRFFRGRALEGRLLVNGVWARVVGVARDAKYENMLEPPEPFFYVPIRQRPSTQVVLLVRTREDPGSLASALGHEIRSLDPALGFSPALRMREQVAQKTATQQIAGMLLTAFSILALVLATVGLYGVMSYAVSGSARELALRLALGATPLQLLRLVLLRGLGLTGLGLALGLLAALGTTRLLGYLLYGVGPRDPLSFSFAFVLTLLAALVSCTLPALRATRTDPNAVLRV